MWRMSFLQPKGEVMEVAGINLSGLLESVAAKLAHTDAETQARFLNIFVKELTVTCDTTYNRDMQGVYIRKHLSHEAQNFCELLIPGEES